LLKRLSRTRQNLAARGPSLKNSIRPKFPKREKITARHCGTPYKSEAETWP
jgi:lambda repressor-like predicted transcriptional regulator